MRALAYFDAFGSACYRYSKIINSSSMRLRTMYRAITVGLASILSFMIAGPVMAVVDDVDSSPFIVDNNFRPDMRTGAFTHSYPLTIPAGRNAVQPNLSLSYSSSASDNASLVGYGWSLNIPYIERINKQGTDDLYSRHDFTSSLSGELEDISLTDATHGTFGAKVDDGSFLSYTYDTGETWTVTDKYGVTYTFGGDTSARIADPSDASHVYRWYITEMRDANDNTVTYTYTQYDNQTYPLNINYTGHDTDSGIFDVAFSLESRLDASTSYASGFAVTTNYRLADISVQVSGAVTRVIDLEYGVGDNGIRSLLSSITETGYDSAGSATAMPATEFTYDSSDRTWTEDASFGGLPISIAGTGNGSMGVYVFDVNGDAYPDIVKSRDTDRAVYINNLDGTWTEDTTISVPVSFATIIGRDMGVRILDVNGDGNQDLVYSRDVDQTVYINNGDGTGWTEDASVSIPVYFTNTSSIDLAVRIFDVDGDGMQDLVQSRYLTYDTGVYINNGDGTGWTEDTDYSIPVYFTNGANYDMGIQPADVNGDGLTDLIYARELSSGLSSAVYLNNGDGTGWTEDSNYSVPVGFVGEGGYDYGVRLIDVNSDGLIDFIKSRYLSSGSYQRGLYINNGDGTGWTEDTSFVAPLNFTNSSGMDFGVRFLDVDADGYEDILYSRDTIGEALYLAQDSSDILTAITQPTGGATAISYGSVADGDVFFPLKVVDSVTTDDGLGNTATTSYAYSDPSYYYADEYDRKFAGFGTVEVTDALGNTTRQYYHQGNGTQSSLGESTDDVSKLWRLFREEQYDASAHLYRTVIHTIANTDLGNDRDFVYESQTLELMYDADSDHRDKATTYTFDTASGNLTEKKDWGLVVGADDGTFSDSGTDIARTSYTYASWTTGGTSGYATAEILRDQYSNRWRHKIYYYDNLAFGSVETGNISRESNWVTGSTVVDTAYTYDSFGLPATVTDPAGNVTTYTPDGYNLYPASITDALGNSTAYEYDYSSGKQVSVTDANGFVFATDYDGLDRPTTEWQPDPSVTTTSVEKKVYSYIDTVVPNVVHVTDYLDATLAKETYTYVNGFGRPVQVRTESGSSGDYLVVDTIYDALGRPAEVSLPYQSSSAAYTSPTTDTTLYQTTEYDALGRVISSTNIEGANTKSYEDWWTTEIDANGETKLYYYDAFGRLTTVAERLGVSTTYTTSYTWTTGGDLTKITDGAGNIRQFSYDNLGRRTVARDLRSTTDGVYGTWNYTFDSNSNLLTSVSPNGVTTTYVYDDLNRVLTEDASSTSGVDVTNVYDTCTNGVGRLCSSAVAGGATTAYTYDALGRVATETKTIDGADYVTVYTYDRQGGLASITYPDDSVTSYAYDTAGQINEVVFTDGSAGGSTTIASNITYAPNGKVESVTYGNGVVSTWDYNQADLYRLDSLTTMSGPATLEDFAYTYDNVGNITNLTDASGLYDDMTLTYGYDDLYRLTSAASVSTDSALTYNKTWTYGAIGNILTSTDCGTYSYLGYQAGNYANPHAVTSVCGKTYTYDNNGNVTSDGTWTNAWNWRNEMTSSTNGTTTVSYQYDHAGNRVRQTNGTTTTIYPNAYYSVDGTELRRHIPAGALGSIATSTYDSATTSAEVVYHHKDHLGGTHVETDESGAVLEYIVYKPFGGTLSDVKSGTYENNLKYTGKEKDSDTGYYYYGARYYNADVGRFLSQDPLFMGLGASTSNGWLTDPQSLNSYSYTRNNPVRFIDPTGESWLAFSIGAANAFLSNMAGGIGRQTATNLSSAMGQSLGDAASIVQGAFEVALGITMSGGGIVASGTGVGAAAGVPAVAAGAVLTAHGATTAASGILHLSQGVGGAIIQETEEATRNNNSGQVQNIQSGVTPTAGEMLDAGENFIGTGYQELGNPGSGVFRSADGTRQFRIDPSSISGNHNPNVPHGHLETFDSNGQPVVNNHVQFTE